ncbi:hypothetical protein JZ751_016042 [Albula glossodonta]|uniref:Uncharacterized protein n=1 Tax=Albula glossodonta TaxID=121402 RepID=A0A8T2NQF5_9TELE|nr:hypothetical protein JZ751_016042 [Albula glossodonta]
MCTGVVGGQVSQEEGKNLNTLTTSYPTPSPQFQGGRNYSIFFRKSDCPCFCTLLILEGGRSRFLPTESPRKTPKGDSQKPLLHGYHYPLVVVDSLQNQDRSRALLSG